MRIKLKRPFEGLCGLNFQKRRKNSVYKRLHERIGNCFRTTNSLVNLGQFNLDFDATPDLFIPVYNCFFLCSGRGHEHVPV